MKIMNKETLPDLLCAGYCSFYKPGKDEGLACRGFSLMEDLVAEGREVPVRTGRIVLDPETENDLFGVICSDCPFFAGDCDFAAWKRGESSGVIREAVDPCGGFLCLGHCIDKGTMDIEDINRVI